MSHSSLSTLIKKRKKLKIIKEAFITIIEDNNEKPAVTESKPLENK